MLKFDPAKKLFSQLDPVLLNELGLKEREHLQESICNSPDTFFAELDEDLLILGSEVEPSVEVGDRIDILGIDENGNAVIVELKRGRNKWQLLQALAYAAMVEQWGTGEDFLERVNKIPDAPPREKLKDVVNVGVEAYNRTQRVILIAESYDWEVLLTSRWLSEVHHVDIACYQVSVAKGDKGDGAYISCTQVYPPKELSEHAKMRGHGRLGTGSVRRDLEAILSQSAKHLASFFRERLKMMPRMNVYKDALAYPRIGTIHWYIEPRRADARVVQVGRFMHDGKEDEAFWTSNLSNAQVRYRRNGRNLHFSLITEEDLEFFKKTMDGIASAFTWKTPGVSEDATEMVE